MTYENTALTAMGCGMLAAILAYLIVYLYNKHNNKIEKWRAGILLADYIFIAIIINGIIIALMTLFISMIITKNNVFTASILSICIFGGINALIALTNNEFKRKGKKFLLYFGIFLLIFGILSILVAKNINIYDLCFIILSIFNFYYYKTLNLEEIKSQKEIKKVDTESSNKKEKKFNKTPNINKLPIIITIIIAITIIIIISIFLLFDYKNEELKSKRLNEIQLDEENRQYYLQNCYDEAKQNRTDLWNANCNNGETDCKLPYDTVDWIDSRYKQDIENCNSLYG